MSLSFLSLSYLLGSILCTNENHLRHSSLPLNLFGKEEQVIENGKKLSVKVDEAYISESIKDPSLKKTVGFENTPMPVFPLTDDEIKQVIAYIKTLKN